MEGERENNDEKQEKYFGTFIAILITGVSTTVVAISGLYIDLLLVLIIFLSGIALIFAAFGYFYLHQESTKAFPLVKISGILTFVVVIVTIIWVVL